ncbi:Potassium channel protein [hydrothermal vent metagenome]|uniref:Potassium channel protein n=1 Tax=hydrothermal vent metagenome TaxID=652676 RepID=A0A1W1E781_9ZZZZ
MGIKKILIFGYGHHGRHIAVGLKEDGYLITVVEQDQENLQQAQKDGFESILINMGEDTEILKLGLEQYDQIVCVMDDEHYNVFLTLSLNALVEGLNIVAISDSVHVTNKLRLAGAKRVIDMYEVSANRIHNILHRPIATELLKEFVINKEGISFMEMEIPKGSFLHGKMSDEVNFGDYGVLLVGLIDFERHKGFEFVTAGHTHHLDAGDIIVCMGEVEKLRIFKKMIAKKDV